MSGINTELYFTGLFSLFWNIFQNARCRVWNCRRLPGLETVRADNLVRLLWFAVNVCSSSWPRLYAVLTCNPESKTQWKLCVAQLKFILILVPNASPLSAPHSPSSSSAEQRRRFFSTFASFFSLHFFFNSAAKMKKCYYYRSWSVSWKSSQGSLTSSKWFFWYSGEQFHAQFIYSPGTLIMSRFHIRCVFPSI